MYSLVHCQDINEYYIFKSRNVIQEEDGSCVVAFKASVIFSNSGSKTELLDIRNNLLEHLSCSQAHDDASKEEVFDSEDDQRSTNSPDTFEQHNYTKRKYCYFCKKIVKKLVKHLMKAHANTKVVKKLAALSKELPERRKLVNRILKKSKEKEIRLQNRTYQKSHGGIITKTIRRDQLIMQFASAEYNPNSNTKRQRDLRILGRILLEMKKHDSTITDLFSVFAPQNIHIFDKIKNRMLTSLGTRLLYRCGKLLLNQHLYKKDFIKKKNVEEFLKLIFKKIRTARGKEKIVITSEDTPASRKKVHVPIVAVKGERSKNENNLEKGSTNIESDNHGQHYLRERNSFSQHSFQQMQDEIYDSVLNEHDQEYSKTKWNKKKSFYCYFCKKKFLSLILHLVKKHGNEEEVLKFTSLPKGSIERKITIDSIIKKGRSEYNKNMKSETCVLQTKPKSDYVKRKPTTNNDIDAESRCDKKKSFYCYFCKKKFLSLIVHLVKKHGNEEEVLKFSSLPKASPERKRMIESIIKKGKSEYNNKNIKSVTYVLQTRLESDKETANNNTDTVQSDPNKHIEEDVLENKNLSDTIPSVIANVITKNYTEEKEIELSDSDDGSSVEDYEMISTSSEFKDILLEADDTKSSLWCMLEDHVNCSSDVKGK